MSFGLAGIANKAVPLYPYGSPPPVIGSARIFNLRQYLRPSGLPAPMFGFAYVQGGVKQIFQYAPYIGSVGFVGVVNTTANSGIYPAGIPAPLIPALNVSPRTVRPAGLFAYASGFHAVQFPPQPRGWQSSTFGRPAIEDKTRRARGEGFDAFSTGYAVVRDRAQKVRHLASPVSAVFGDVALRLKSQRISPPGLASFGTSLFAEVRSTRRHVLSSGFSAGGTGAHEARNKTPSVAPAGRLSLVWGGADIGWRVRGIRPVGVPAPFAQLPPPSLWQTPGLKPNGIAAPDVQRPTIWPAVRAVYVSGADAARAGAATIGFAYRSVAPAGLDTLAVGAPRTEHGNRTLLAQGALRDAYGQSWISFGLRALAPEGTPPPIDRSTPMVGGLRFLHPDGFVATRFGTRIVPEIQVLYPLGFAGVFGLAEARNRIRHLRPASLTTYTSEDQRWGGAKAYSSRQYITQDYIEGSGLTPPAWPSWTAIENRNKQMRASGSAMARMGAAQVHNGARAILVQGAETPGPSASAMAAYRVRYLPLEGLDAPYIARWSVVANKAVVLKPGVFVGADFGAATIESNRRTITRAGGIFSQWFDAPFAAPRVRGVQMDSRYGIAPPPVRLPDVQLLTRYVDVDRGGVGPREVGRASLQVIWRGIVPRWTHRDFFGEPRLHNVTPELGSRGWVAEEFGGTAVRLQWRPVAVVQDSTMSLFGRPRISDKTQRIVFAGSDTSRIGDKLKVARIGVQPPSLQMIVVRNDRDPQEDFIDLHYQVPKPTLNQQVIYVIQEKPNTLWGDTRADSNGVRVEPGYWDHLIGEPFVSLKRRTLAVAKFPASEVFDPPRPRLSPHTIYAVMEAPHQAKMNHPLRPGAILHPVNSGVGTREPGEVFGRPEAALRHRTVRPSGYVAWPAEVGRPAVSNRRQHIGAGGHLSLRFGWPVVPGPRALLVEQTGSSSQHGLAAVSRPPYVGPQTVRPTGMGATVFAKSSVDHLHRSVRPHGVSALAMGASIQREQPYAWQSLHVGPPMPTMPLGIESENYGAAWVSQRVRGVGAEGFDAFVCEYDLLMFAQRMRVRGTSEPPPPTQKVTPAGPSQTCVGGHALRNKTHYIRPDGNSDQHRKGAF